MPFLKFDMRHGGPPSRALTIPIIVSHMTLHFVPTFCVCGEGGGGYCSVVGSWSSGQHPGGHVTGLVSSHALLTTSLWSSPTWGAGQLVSSVCTTPLRATGAGGHGQILYGQGARVREGP